MASLHVTVYLKFRSSPLLQFVLSHHQVKLISVLVPSVKRVLSLLSYINHVILCYMAAEISSQEWRVPHATWPTALWVQQSSERCGCVFKLTRTGDWAVGKCFSTSAITGKLLASRNDRKVIGIVTVPCRIWCPQNICGRKAELFSCMESVYSSQMKTAGRPQVQLSVSWQQLYLGSSEVLLWVYKWQPRSWHMQYPWQKKKANCTF